MHLPAFTTDRESAAAGETVRVHASAALSPCRLEVTRVGRTREIIAVFDGIEVADHPVPDSVETRGCEWPAWFNSEVGKHWPQGYSDLRLIQPDGAASHHYLVVKRGP